MKLKNISLDTFRAFLNSKGLIISELAEDMKKWSKQSMRRPVILQTHIDPVPEFIIPNNLRSMESTARELETWLTKSKK